jgi:C-terminal peptidase prc
MGQSFSYEATFDEVWQTINSRFYDPNFGGVDWDEIGVRYRPRVVGADSDSAFYVTLNEMLFELGVSHIGVIPPDHPEWIGAPAVFADGEVGADVRILNDEIVIISVKPDSPAEAAGLRAGMVIQRIDGLMLAEMRAEALAPPVAAIDTRMIVNENVQGRLYGPSEAEVTVEIGRGEETRAMTLRRQPRPGRTEFMEGIPPMYLEFESRRITGRFGYIRFNSFHAALLDDILDAIDGMQDAEGIVIDLRGNPGGDFRVRRALVEKLVAEPVRFWTYRGRNGDDVIRVEPHPRPYTGAVAIIVDRTSASSSEEFSGGLQAIERAAVVGERTPGSVLAYSKVAASSLTSQSSSTSSPCPKVGTSSSRRRSAICARLRVAVAHPTDETAAASVEFRPFSQGTRGLVFDVLRRSYQKLLDELPDAKVEELVLDWRAYDDAVFDEPDTVGDCGFFTCLGDEFIGFASWNPLDWPETAVIGHNCILPDHQGRGYGKRQVTELVARFTRSGFEKVSVETDEHPFFAPARRMYEKCGFEEVGRRPGVLIETCEMIEYEKRLEDAAANGDDSS